MRAEQGKRLQMLYADAMRHAAGRLWRFGRYPIELRGHKPLERHIKRYLARARVGAPLQDDPMASAHLPACSPARLVIWRLWGQARR